MNSKSVLAFAISLALTATAANAGTLVRAAKGRIDKLHEYLGV